MTGRPNRVIPIQDRFMRHVAPQADGCWLWTGAVTGGYGQLRGGRSRSHKVMFAHRLAYELFTGAAVPDDLTIDHLCRVPLCVNPLHLDPVTIQVNIQRGVIARRAERRAS